MGWWHTNEKGNSFSHGEQEMFWGDGPADIMDDAIAIIENKFMYEWNRKPTRAELIAGLLFSINVDYPEV